MSKRLDSAIKYAIDKHQGQLRKREGTPYILHPLEAAAIANDLTKDENVLIAAVLHDTVEDTEATIEEVREKFGDNAPQIGEVPTLENYQSMVPGEEPIDLSYIPGAVVDVDNLRYTEPINLDISSIKEIDEDLLGEWSMYSDLTYFTYTYIFNDDNTGYYITSHYVYNTTTGEQELQDGSQDFEYSVINGIVNITFDNGNTKVMLYEFDGDTVLFDGEVYDRTNSRAGG